MKEEVQLIDHHHRNLSERRGCALSFASNKFNIGCKVCMVRVSYDQKNYRKLTILVYSAEVVAIPNTGARDQPAYPRQHPTPPPHLVSLGIIISDVLEYVFGRDGTKYASDSVLNRIILR